MVGDSVTLVLMDEKILDCNPKHARPNKYLDGAAQGSCKVGKSVDFLQRSREGPRYPEKSGRHSVVETPKGRLSDVLSNKPLADAQPSWHTQKQTLQSRWLYEARVTRCGSLR